MVRRGALLGLILCALAACRPSARPPPPPDEVATVNGEPITKGQLEKALTRSRRDDAGLNPRTSEDRAALRDATLQDLVDQALLLQAARAANVTVPPERVDRELLRLKAEYPGPSFDEALAQGGTTTEELREQTRRELTIEEFFARQVFSRVAVTDPDVEAYYKAHLQEFAHPEEVHAEQILVGDPETARKVQSQLKSGGRFEELARKYSISPDAKVGGDLGWFAAGQMPEAFDQTCFALKPGQVSDVVASPYGYHLFKVLEKRPAGTPALADIRPKVEAKLRHEREAAAQASTLEELRKKARVEIHQKVLAAVP